MHDTKEPKMAGHCGPCSPAMRNRYYRGKLLTVSDYEAEQRYMIQRRRLVNRAVLGWGLVSGFDVESDGKLTVHPGVALDRHGRELVLCEPYTICDEDDVVWLRPGKCGLEPSDQQPAPGSYLLSAHYAECPIDGVRVDNGCGEVVCEPNHICETVSFSLRPADDRCPPFRVGDCTDLAPQPDQSPAEIPKSMPYVAPRRGHGPAGLCRTSCDGPRKPAKENPDSPCPDCRDGPCRDDFDPCCVPKLSTLGGCDIDFDASVPLVHVEVVSGKCGPAFGELTRIIGCCEPTAIKDIGWRNWHQLPGLEIERGPFFSMFVPPAETSDLRPDRGSDDEQQPDLPPVDTHFWVCFTGPVQIASLTPDVITMSLANDEKYEAVLNVVLVPIIRIWCAPTTPGDPPGTTRGFRPLVDYKFWHGEIHPHAKSGLADSTFVEIRINACAIVDWCGHAIDGCSVGRHLPTGLGCHGGDFVSSWRVVRRGGAQIPPIGAIPASSSAS